MPTTCYLTSSNCLTNACQVLTHSAPPGSSAPCCCKEGLHSYKNCNRFWKGAWQSLALGAQQDLQVCNVLAQEKNHAAQQQPPDTASVHSAQVLERARQLQYSKAMNLLRSPGLARQSLEEIAETLQALHPQEGQLDLDQTLSPDEGGSLNASTVAFITGKWFSRQIRSSAKGTAVDQWGCD